MNRRRGHPSTRKLALLAGGELGWWLKLRVGHHVSACRECRAELESLRDARREVAVLAQEMPPEVNWDHLAAEMKANIRLGIEAGQIVAPAAAVRARIREDEDEFESYGSFFKPVVALASVAVFLYGATWMLSTRGKMGAAAGDVMVATTGEGIEFKHGASSMTLFHQGGKPMAVEVSAGARTGSASLRAQYVDEDTGEVTIHHVYSE
ncbi:MAG TPA: hypothetical protein VFB63_26625 [Bryobacteraceae bacterium]|nr:hypothetical protein [Bryobacteraceae bacterium]